MIPGNWPNWTGNVRKHWWYGLQAERMTRCIDSNGKGYDLAVWVPVNRGVLRQILKQTYRDQERLSNYQNKISQLHGELKVLREQGSR